jgi:hypothetical protein
MPRATWTAKDERQYKAIVKNCTKTKKVCRRIAAATVNKRRALEGRTKKYGCVNRVGITLRYSLDSYLGDRHADRKIIAKARRAVPRLPRHPDTGAGPFGSKGKKCAPKRDIEFDFWKGSCGLTDSEAKKLTRAFKGTGVMVQKKKIRCCGSRPG